MYASFKLILSTLLTVLVVIDDGSGQHFKNVSSDQLVRFQKVRLFSYLPGLAKEAV